jgi:hypothetical protein
VLVTSDEGLKTYLANVLRQLAGEHVICSRRRQLRPSDNYHVLFAAWLTAGQVQKLIVVITGVDTREVLERWVFNVETDKAALAPG